MALKSLAPLIADRRICRLLWCGLLLVSPAGAAENLHLMLDDSRLSAATRTQPLSAPDFLPPAWPQVETSVEPEDLPPHDALPEPEPQPGDYRRRGFGYLLKQHRRISSRVDALARNVDRYLAGDAALAEDNETYLRMRLAETWIEGGQWDPENDLKFRLDLPATKDRYRFVVAYRPDDETDSLAQRTLPGIVVRPDSGDESFFAGAVSTVKNEALNWEGRAQIGIKARWPPDPFVRLNGRRRVELNPWWAMSVRNGASWFNSSGFRTEHALAFDRILNPVLLFRSTSSAQWREEEDTLEFGQVLDLFYTLDQQRLLDFQFGVLGHSASNPGVDVYYLSTLYRRDLYRGWLYLNLVPQVAYPRDEDFRAITSFTAGIEVLFDQF